MKTMEDVILEHAEKVKKGSSTSDGIRFLELPDRHEFNSAGNIYIAALSIINKLNKEIDRLYEDMAGEDI